jgi:hypothetical protein
LVFPPDGHDRHHDRCQGLSGRAFGFVTSPLGQFADDEAAVTMRAAHRGCADIPDGRFEVKRRICRNGGSGAEDR